MASKTETVSDEFAPVRHLVGKHVKIIAKDHPWYESVGHIIGWERTFDGTPFCEVELTEPYGHRVAIFNGKDLKYI